MTRWISLSGPRDIAWVVLYSRFVAPVTQRVQICWDSITHPCIIFGKMLPNVCLCYQKNIANYPIKSVPIIIMIMFGISFLFIVQLISDEIIIKPWTLNNTSGLQIFLLGIFYWALFTFHQFHFFYGYSICIHRSLNVQVYDQSLVSLYHLLMSYQFDRLIFYVQDVFHRYSTYTVYPVIFAVI